MVPAIRLQGSGLRDVHAFGGLEALAATITFAVIPLIYFIIIPFIDNSNDLHPLARPVVTAFGILGIIYLVILSLWGGALAPVWRSLAGRLPQSLCLRSS
ncbi:hypothetical protein [Thermogymnomonas acidicola]|uniref:hypothetical protein n=1 Tax=Thermogymnomonas acidicola TaxID=399579 RepID=UPI001396805D|nr:hypothetical protein [Thermogymnomonas acidicola]